jgi:hypothetical protein
MAKLRPSELLGGPTNMYCTTGVAITPVYSASQRADCTNQNKSTPFVFTTRNAIYSAFAKLRIQTISFVMSVRPSVRPPVRTEPFGSHWTDFYEIWYLIFFRKSVEKIQISLISDHNNNGTLHEDRYTFFIISRSFLLRMKNVSGKIVEKVKTHILGSITGFQKSCRLWDNVEKKNSRAGQATDGNILRNMRIACRVPKATNTHPLRLCNTHWFPHYTNACFTNAPDVTFIHTGTYTASLINQTVSGKVRGSINNEILTQQTEGRSLI